MSEYATLGGGCYWCLEAVFQRVRGVVSVVSGYSGGTTVHPRAEDVYRGDTGHAEVVQLEFDPSVVAYRELLEIFFVMHDPTTLNRQGNDVGEWYRSVIFFHSNSQKQIAAEVIRDFAAPLWPGPVVTAIEPFTEFWAAESSMQEFYNRNPNAGYCQLIINPKIIKLRQKFASKLKPA